MICCFLPGRRGGSKTRAQRIVMPTPKLLLIPVLVLSASLAFASIDLSDFDDELMRNMDDAIKALDGSINAKDVQASATDAQFIAEGLEWAEGYFTAKGDVPDAVQWAAQGRELAATLASEAGKSDFDAAFTSYRALVKTCRSCHDVYKPPSL